MADIIICSNEELIDIANAIREKTGSSDLMSVADMPELIESIGATSSVQTFSITFPSYSDPEWLFSNTDWFGWTAFENGAFTQKSALLVELIRAGSTINNIVPNSYVVVSSSWFADSLDWDTSKFVETAVTRVYVIQNNVIFTLDTNIPI